MDCACTRARACAYVRKLASSGAMRYETRDEAVQQTSVFGSTYFVRTSRVLCERDEHDGYAVEFRSCTRAKSVRIFLALTILGFLYVTISFLLVFNKLVPHAPSLATLPSLGLFSAGRLQHSGPVSLHRLLVFLFHFLLRTLHLQRSELHT